MLRTHYNLTNYQINKIKSAISRLYSKIKYRSLGIGNSDTKFDLYSSLPGLYGVAAMENRIAPDPEALKSLIQIASSYLDAQKEATTAKVIHGVESNIRQTKIVGHSNSFEVQLRASLKEIFDKAISDIKRILNSEANTFKNTSLLHGIVAVNANNGNTRPVVGFTSMNDAERCKDCTRLHTMDGGSVPRLWYLHELSAGYFKKGNSTPSVSGIHPHCRCALFTILPGFGFDPAGRVIYVGPGYSEIDLQREVFSDEEDTTNEQSEVKKSEPYLEPEDLPEASDKLFAADLEPLVDADTGRMVIGTNEDFKEFAKNTGDGVFVAFRGSKTDLDKETLCRVVPDAVQSATPNARIFVKGKTFKIFVANQDVADTVVASIQNAILEGD